jgi:cholesterol transport system auxiliary component
MKAVLLAILGAALLPGCALLGKSDPVVSRYFTLEDAGDPAAVRAPAGLQLRLGRIEAWSHLRERMVARNAARELAYSENRRWTERPEVFLRRALARTLFEERGVVEVLSGRAVTLDVELMAFEEMEQPHQVRMQVGLVLRDDRTSLLQQTITVERPVARSDGPDGSPAAVDAFSQALRAGVTQIADRVVMRLAAPPPPSAP